MAIMTEESDSVTPLNTPKPTTKPSKLPPPKPSTPNPFTFWFYFTLSVSLITLVFISLSSLSPHQDPKTWFLNLPTNLRHHYSNGRTIKVQTTPNQPSIEIFTIQEGPVNSGNVDNVLIVHGLGCSSFTFRGIVKLLGKKGLRVVALDLPGSGFSDKSVVVVEERPVLGLERVWELYREIREKGLFWGFDQLVENGYVNYDHEEDEIRVSKRESVKPIELGSEEMGRVLGQVIDSMGLAPVHLVLHDSAFGLGANWVSENLGLIRSIMLLDSTSKETALPLWVLEMPVVRHVVLGFEFVFRKVVGWCCSKSGGGSNVAAHRILLKGRDGREAVVGMGKKMNSSFDIAEWGSMDGVKGLPMQVIWSSHWSEEWNEEGHRVSIALPWATFVTHSGGRWPQEDTADELAESMHQFLSSLPKIIKQVEEEPIPEHIQKMLDEAKDSDHDRHHHHGHSHGHEAGFMEAYGLGHGLS